MANTEKKLTEAINRMEKLKIHEPVIEEFKTCLKREYSEPTQLGGILYWVDNEPTWAKIVEDFENEYHALVYHVIHSYTSFGELLNLLYVSDDEEEWEYDNSDIDDGYVFSYVVNLSEPLFSEFGTIGVKNVSGGLIRTD